VGLARFQRGFYGQLSCLADRGLFLKQGGGQVVAGCRFADVQASGAQCPGRFKVCCLVCQVVGFLGDLLVRCVFSLSSPRASYARLDQQSGSLFVIIGFPL